ncbi:unnamed protein product [Choristocarpus tenellus]
MQIFKLEIEGISSHCLLHMEAGSPRPSLYLALSNPSTRNNLGNLIRCAAAFAVEEICVVGANKWSTHGAHGAHKHVRYTTFHDWTSAGAYLRGQKGCDLCGIVSPPPRAPLRPAAMGVDGENDVVCTAQVPKPVHTRPFHRSTAFIVGHKNELEKEVIEICDYMVYVAQVLDVPMRLDAPISVSIALHHFTAWAQYEERQFSGEKFLVEAKPILRRPPPTTQGESSHDLRGLAKERVRRNEEHAVNDPMGEGKGEELCGEDAEMAGGGEEDSAWGSLRWLDIDEDAEQGDY